MTEGNEAVGVGILTEASLGLSILVPGAAKVQTEREALELDCPQFKSWLHHFSSCATLGTCHVPLGASVFSSVQWEFQLFLPPRVAVRIMWGRTQKVQPSASPEVHSRLNSVPPNSHLPRTCM